MNLQPSDPESGLVDPAQPGASVFGLAMAALIMTVFGFVWLGWGFSVDRAFTDFSSNKAAPAIRWITFYISFLALLGTSIQVIRKGKKVFPGRSGNFRARFQKRFRLISMAEGAGCGIVVFLALTFHRLDLLAAAIGLVVGLHFLPLAQLFHFPAYYAAGIAIVLCDLLSLILLNHDAITLAAGIATGSVLWITALYALLCAEKLLRIAASRQASL
jgi:hypothetical protein